MIQQEDIIMENTYGIIIETKVVNMFMTVNVEKAIMNMLPYKGVYHVSSLV
jgi:hypothetical protein